MMTPAGREPLHLPFMLALFAALLLVPEFPSPSVRPTAGWRGWYVLLYAPETAPAVEAALAAWGDPTVSRRTATVQIDAFAEIETLPVSAIAERLDQRDPRLDGWVSGIDGYFRATGPAGSSFVAYVPATRGRLAAWARLRRLLRARGVRTGWRLLEFEPLVMIAGLAGALGFALAVAGSCYPQARRRLPLAAAGALAWLPAILNGSLADVSFCCLALYLWIPEAIGGERRDARSSAGSRQTGVRIGVLLAAAVLVIATGDAAVYRATRMAASIAGMELLGRVSWPFARRRSRRARQRFQPVPILAPQAPAAAPFAAALAAMLLVGIPAAVSRQQVPLPRATSPELSRSRPAASPVPPTAGEGRLAGLAEAVAHVASLQVFAFERVDRGDTGTDTASGALPLEERVRLREYRRGSEPPSLIEAPRTVSQLDAGWIRRTVAGFRVGTVERILVDQRRAVEVRLRAPREPVRSSFAAALVCLVVLGAPVAGPSARRHLKRLGLWGITEPARSSRSR
jgi:hypothetical protein